MGNYGSIPYSGVTQDLYHQANRNLKGLHWFQVSVQSDLDPKHLNPKP